MRGRGLRHKEPSHRQVTRVPLERNKFAQPYSPASSPPAHAALPAGDHPGCPSPGPPGHPLACGSCRRRPRRAGAGPPARVARPPPLGRTGANRGQRHGQQAAGAASGGLAGKAAGPGGCRLHQLAAGSPLAASLHRGERSGVRFRPGLPLRGLPPRDPTFPAKRHREHSLAAPDPQPLSRRSLRAGPRALPARRLCPPRLHQPAVCAPVRGRLLPPAHAPLCRVPPLSAGLLWVGEAGSSRGRRARPERRPRSGSRRGRQRRSRRRRSGHSRRPALHPAHQPEAW